MYTVNLKNTPVLVLNATYEAVNIVSGKRAFTSVMKGIAVVEEVSEEVIHTRYLTLPIPSMIRLLSYRRIPRRTRTLSRKGILTRDRHTCQYCMSEEYPSRLTLDHIIPRSRGGGNVWENLVACCFGCNNKKGDRTPEEAGMPLLRRSKPFTIHTSRHLLRDSALDREDWQKYLYYKSQSHEEVPVA